MSQFDVYRNPGRSTARSMPFLVDVQSELLSELATRIVIPLGKSETVSQLTIARLSPRIDFDGALYALLTPLMAGVALRRKTKAAQENRSTGEKQERRRFASSIGTMTAVVLSPQGKAMK